MCRQGLTFVPLILVLPYLWGVFGIQASQPLADILTFAVALPDVYKRQAQGRPTVILARTVKGKGVSFMENNAGWHGKAPNDEQYEQAIAELRAALAQLEVN